MRDRLRLDRILERRLLSRHIDYIAGTLRFREPILSRSPGLDPQFIVADYEVDGLATRRSNAGARVSWRTNNHKLKIAATAIHDENEITKTNLVGADVRYQHSPSTEIRAEVAVSDSKAQSAGTELAGGTATAWHAEAEHRGSRFDILAYVRTQESGFGLGQTNASENGTRKFGVDGRARLGGTWVADGQRLARILSRHRRPSLRRPRAD